jgi:8-hydroxy-5-deazaflavin:NADPH oxidoreductase
MNIAVIGTGNVGRTLANLWAAHGHSVWVGTRDPGSAKSIEFARTAHAGIHLTTVADAAAQAAVVLLAVPWGAARETIAAAGSLSGKILLDAINPLLGGGKVAVGFNTSAAEEIAGWAAGAKVVKAFNTTGSGNMANPNYGGIKTDMFFCGDDEQAKSVAAELIAELDLNPVDCGPLSMARNLEPLAALWVHLAYSAGYGPNFMFKIVRR